MASRLRYLDKNFRMVGSKSCSFGFAWSWRVRFLSIASSNTLSIASTWNSSSTARRCVAGVEGWSSSEGHGAALEGSLARSVEDSATDTVEGAAAGGAEDAQPA